MTAELLRDAAEVLRERAEAATPEYGWNFHDGGVRSDGTQPGDSDLIAFISLMSPSVGLAIAKWLADVAAGWMWDEDPEDVETPDGWPLTLEESMDMHPLTIARAILEAGR